MVTEGLFLSPDQNFYLVPKSDTFFLITNQKLVIQTAHVSCSQVSSRVGNTSIEVLFQTSFTTGLHLVHYFVDGVLCFEGHSRIRTS